VIAESNGNDIEDDSEILKIIEDVINEEEDKDILEKIAATILSKY
jgi:Asp-tRNA(Asn)/Glu-tRNA(Gln) amidotransferase B subunit